MDGKQHDHNWRFMFHEPATKMSTEEYAGPFSYFYCSICLTTAQIIGLQNTKDIQVQIFPNDPKNVNELINGEWHRVDLDSK